MAAELFGMGDFWLEIRVIIKSTPKFDIQSDSNSLFSNVTSGSIFYLTKVFDSEISTPFLWQQNCKFGKASKLEIVFP